MNVKQFGFILTLILMMNRGWAAPQPYQAARQAPRDDINSLVGQFKTALADLKHEVRNHESEIRTFEEKLHNQESSFDQFRQEIFDEVQSQRDFVRASNINLEGKTDSLDHSIKNLEEMARGTMADLRQIKVQANESVNVLAQYKQKLSELEQLIETQSLHMQNLEAALQSIVEVWKAKEATREIGNKGTQDFRTYKVQPGDTLGQIAISQKTTLQALRDANHLTNDRIVVGQVLKIP